MKPLLAAVWTVLAIIGLMQALSCTRKPPPEQLNGPWKRNENRVRRIPENAGIHRDGTFHGRER